MRKRNAIFGVYLCAWLNGFRSEIMFVLFPLIRFWVLIMFWPCCDGCLRFFCKEEEEEKKNGTCELNFIDSVWTGS